MEKQDHPQNVAPEVQSFLLRRIVDLCAPVLAGVKPAALIRFSREHRNLNLAWNENRTEFEKQSPLARLDFFELRKTPRETLVLFYRRIQLTNVLTEQPNRLFLTRLGYHSWDLPETLDRIRSRFQAGCPHEVGIILGIPILDVTGFISNRGRNYLLNGYWKVYHNPEQALRTFSLYDQARRDAAKVMTGLHPGRPLPFLQCSPGLFQDDSLATAQSMVANYVKEGHRRNRLSSFSVWPLDINRW